MIYVDVNNYHTMNYELQHLYLLSEDLIYLLELNLLPFGICLIVMKIFWSYWNMTDRYTILNHTQT